MVPWVWTMVAERYIIIPDEIRIDRGEGDAFNPERRLHRPYMRFEGVCVSFQNGYRTFVWFMQGTFNTKNGVFNAVLEVAFATFGDQEGRRGLRLGYRRGQDGPE